MDRSLFFSRYSKRLKWLGLGVNSPQPPPMCNTHRERTMLSFQLHQGMIRWQVKRARVGNLAKHQGTPYSHPKDGAFCSTVATSLLWGFEDNLDLDLEKDRPLLAHQHHFQQQLSVCQECKPSPHLLIFGHKAGVSFPSKSLKSTIWWVVESKLFKIPWGDIIALLLHISRSLESVYIFTWICIILVLLEHVNWVFPCGLIFWYLVKFWYLLLFLQRLHFLTLRGT